MALDDLYMLVANQQWLVAINHIQSLADGDAVDQIFFQNLLGIAAIMMACYHSAPLELYQVMITKAKLDQGKRCLLAIAHCRGDAVLRYAAWFHPDPAVFELLISEHPLGLQTVGSSCHTPQQTATVHRNTAPMISLLTDTADVLAAGYFAALAARVHGDERTLRRLALSPDRLTVRVTLLLCVEHGYVNIRRS